MKAIWSLLIALTLCVNANSQCLTVSVIQQEKSNLLLIDSSKLMNDFLAYDKTQKFLSTYRDSSYSFVCSPRILFFEGQTFLKKRKKLNLFDSTCVDFVYDYVLDYKWGERVKRNKIYRILFSFVYDNEEKQLSIKAEDMTSQPFKSVFRIEKSIQ